MTSPSRFLFVSLGRPENALFVFDFLHRIAQSFPDSNYVFLTDSQYLGASQVPNLKVQVIQPETYGHGLRGTNENDSALAAINQFVERIEAESYRKIYYLDALGWGFWITSCLPEDRVKTISLSDFETPIAKYNYLMNLFECPLDELSLEAFRMPFQVVETAEEFYRISRRKQKVLLKSYDDADPLQTIFSPFQAVARLGREDDAAKWQQEQYIRCIVEGTHRLSSAGKAFPDFDLCEVDYDGSHLVRRSSALVTEEYGTCIEVAKSFFQGCERPEKDRFLLRAAVLRLRRIVGLMLHGIEDQGRLFSGFDNQYLDLQIGNELLDFCDPLVQKEGAHWLSEIQEQIINFSYFLVGYEETIQFDPILHPSGRRSS